MDDVAVELSKVPYLSPAEFNKLLESGGDYTVIDTRRVGQIHIHIYTHKHISTIFFKISLQSSHKSFVVVIICFIMQCIVGLFLVKLSVLKEVIYRYA